MIEIDRSILGPCMPRAFTPAHLQQSLNEVEIGAPLLIVGFPLGFHDGLHHLPVARQAAIASSFGTRFQGLGLFLTDAEPFHTASNSVHDDTGSSCRLNETQTGLAAGGRWAGKPSEGAGFRARARERKEMRG